MRRASGTPAPIPDSYGPARLDIAWTEYREADSARNTPMHYQAFRAGYRRGVAFGVELAGSTFICDPEPHVSGSELSE